MTPCPCIGCELDRENATLYFDAEGRLTKRVGNGNPPSTRQRLWLPRRWPDLTPCPDLESLARLERP